MKNKAVNQEERILGLKSKMAEQDPTLGEVLKIVRLSKEVVMNRGEYEESNRRVIRLSDPRDLISVVR